MELPTTRSSAIRSMLADEAMAEAVVPWPCPSEFGRGGRYLLEELIGIGRRSFVYRARDTLLSSQGFDALVAIKIVPSRPFAKNDALSARRVSHPHVLQVIDRGEDEAGSTYTVAEYLNEGTLADCKVPWTVKKAASFMAQLARGVQACHTAGVVHCDIKPNNILMRRGEPVLGDFDLAYSPEFEEDPSPRGNLAFMSPQQFEKAPHALTPASDVYALGGVLYWLLTGNSPHGEAYDDVIAFHREKRTPAAPSKDRDLNAITAKALSREPATRYQSAQSFAEDLDNWLAKRPLSWARPSFRRRVSLLVQRRPGRVGFGVATAFLLAGAAAFGYDQTVGAQRREIETNQKIIAKTQQEMEELKKGMRTVLIGAANAWNSPGKNTPEKLLPALYWLDWFREHAVMSKLGTIALPNKQIEALEEMVLLHEQDGRAADLEMQIARYALVGYLIDAGRAPEAVANIERLEELWEGRMSSEDPVRASLGTMRRAAEAERDFLAGGNRVEAANRVEDILEELRANRGHEKLQGVLRRQVERLRAPDSPSE